MPQSALQYYDDPNNYGSYQWVSLKDILDGMLFNIEADDDHILKNTKRFALSAALKRGIREVTKRAARTRQMFEITVPPSLVWPSPQDFVKYESISMVVLDETTGSYRLQLLDINPEISTAFAYLQDNNYELIFDDEGEIITTDAYNAIAKPYKRYSYCTTDASKLSAWGEFNIDADRGLIVFSSDLSDKNIVITYKSDGLQANLTETEIKVHKDLRNPIEDYAYWQIIRFKRNVGRGDKQDAKQAYYTSLHRSKIDQANFDLLQIARTLRANPLP